MSRIRTIKPEFFTDDDVSSLPPWVRLLYVGLWTQADRFGRLEDRPKHLKLHLLPYDNLSVEEGLDLLAAPKRPDGPPFILRYSVDGKGYIQILAFNLHQRPKPEEKPRNIPAPTVTAPPKGIPEESPRIPKGLPEESQRIPQSVREVELEGELEGEREGEGEGERELAGALREPPVESQDGPDPLPSSPPLGGGEGEGGPVGRGRLQDRLRKWGEELVRKAAARESGADTQ